MLKVYGKQLAATKHSIELTVVRNHLLSLAQQFPGREFTADDAREFMMRVWGNDRALGNAMGSLFQEPHWEPTGEMRPSSWPPNHGHRNMVWRLKREGE
jgi:hypothetical protein